MVMKVAKINPITFRADKHVTKLDNNTEKKPQIKELSNTTPTYNVQAPQKYKTLGVTELSNGLKIHSYKLANGHRVTIVPMEGSPTIVKNYVNVGSMNETDDIKGISHFLEHMAFNGTTGENGYIKLETGDSFKKIDKLGGWTNASTNYALTDYVNSTPMLDEKDLEEQIKVIAAMTENLALTPEMIEKEKGPVCSEINMILDNPKTILADQTVRTLFNIKSSADELVGGSTRHIKNLTREKVKEYYDKYYTPDNMNLVITGEVEPNKTIELVAKNFHSTKTRKGNFYEEKLTPINKTVRKDIISDKTTSTNIMLGFAGPKNNDTKSKIIFDILSQYLASTDAGINKELKKLNTSGDLCMDKISTNPNNQNVILFALDSSEENSEKTLKVIFDKLSTIKSPSQKDLEIIKEGLLQDYKNALEYSLIVSDLIGNSIINGEADMLANYETILKSITTDDIDNFIKNYLNLDKVAITLVHPQTTLEEINKNYTAANKLSFKSNKKPINTNKISEQTLDNNFRIGFYETKNNNIYFNLSLRYDLPDDIKPSTRVVLNRILDMGTMETTEDELSKFKEQNNLSLYAGISAQKLKISGTSSQENFEKNVKKAKELLESPRITEETLNIAKSKIKDSLSRSQDSAKSLFTDYESKYNPLLISKKQLLEEIDSITLEDVKKLHKYVLANSKGTITINTPEKSPQMKEKSVEIFNSFNQVQPYSYKKQAIYQRNEKPIVLAKEKNISQADISETFKFKYNDNIKDIAMMEIMNTILSSSSIGLFNTLREKEHLAYSVYSDINRTGDCAVLSCNILTTTDNKEIGEISYDNVQKSIDGFNRQIKALLNSEYTDDDFESAKRLLKANLLDKEGTPAKLSVLEKGLNSKEGLDYYNQMFKEIDNITRDDLDNFIQKAFQNPPIYSIVASAATLNANKKYLKSLEQI